MQLVAKQPVAILLMTFALVSPAGAGPDMNETKLVGDAGQFTGKERLSAKWKDEQRIDDCKVPLDKRGAKPRSDSCVDVPTR